MHQIWEGLLSFLLERQEKQSPLSWKTLSLCAGDTAKIRRLWWPLPHHCSSPSLSLILHLSPVPFCSSVATVTEPPPEVITGWLVSFFRFSLFLTLLWCCCYYGSSLPVTNYADQIWPFFAIFWQPSGEKLKDALPLSLLRYCPTMATFMRFWLLRRFGRKTRLRPPWTPADLFLLYFYFFIYVLL